MIGAAALTDTLKQEAQQLGFALAGACPAAAPPHLEQFRQWLEAGYAGQMRYLGDRREAYEHPRHVLDGVRSILMLAVNYRTEEPQSPRAGQGRVSRYAWGTDYHDLVHERLAELIQVHRRLAPDASVRGVVDTAPLLEREFAQLAGLGWIGKNTLLLNKRLGSWFFLAAILTSEELVYDQPFEGSHCGTCRACLDACPTGALVAPYRLDARRCISYLTIELRDHIPRELRQPQGSWVFGCDVCQDVCPWNRRAPATNEESFQPRAESNPMELAELFSLDDAAFRRRFRHTPLWRPRRRGLLRNAAIALGNNDQSEASQDALQRGLSDVEPLVRAACAWALGRHDSPRAEESLRQRLTIESDKDVAAEILAALHRTNQTGE
jgi:epoxyqueuosine reductase